MANPALRTIIADFTEESLDRFLTCLPNTFYADRREAIDALRLGRPFNVIYMPMAFKFDFFPASAFPLGFQELNRVIFLADTGLSETPAPFVTPEDILLAKLYWYRAGGEISGTQWRDIQGIVRACGASLDREYLEQNAEKLGVSLLLEKAFTEGRHHSRISVNGKMKNIFAARTQMKRSILMEKGIPGPFQTALDFLTSRATVRS